MRRAALIAAVAGGLLGACTVGPNYVDPKLATPAAYSDAPTDAQAAPLGQVSGDPTDLIKWWTQFRDPELDRLVERALAGNLDLQSAASRIRQARQQEIIAGAPGLPSVTANGAGVRLRESGGPSQSNSSSSANSSTTGGSAQGQSGASGGGGFQLPSALNLYSAGFDATWEIDLFGGVRRAVESARATTEAAVWTRRDTQVSLTAEVATDYLGYRALQQQIAALVDLQKREEETLGIVRSRFKAGVVTELDVTQENSQLATIRAQIPQLQAQARADVHALGVLLGEQPEALSDELAAAAATPGVPATLPVGLPSDLLRRRPDVRAAERQFASATAEVGVATSQLYPKFDLIGLASLTSTTPGGLVSDPALNTGLVGVIQWPLFAGGRIKATIAADDEKRQQAYLAYQKAVLTAVQNVEDALARYGAEQRQNLALRQGLDSAQRAVVIARDQYTHGLTNGLTLLTNEQTVLRTQQQLAQSDGTMAQSLAALFKALGGGWSDDPPPKT